MATETIEAPQRVDAAGFSYTIRPVAESDLPDMLTYYQENEAAEPSEQEPDIPSLAELRRWWNDPRSKHNRWSALRLLNPDGSEGKVIADFEYEHKDDDPDAGWSGLYVQSGYRNHGIGSRLHDAIEQMAQADGVAKLYNGSRADHKLKREFLAKRGFEFDRYWWNMRLPAETVVPTPQLPDGYTVRTFVRGQDEALFMDIRNTTFAEHFGSTPYTIETATYLTEQEPFQPEGLFFAFKGDEIAGYCWSAISQEEMVRRGIKVGWIEHLGTAPAHRGVGLGRALILIGIQRLRQHVDIVELGMEGKNDPAMNLYKSVGFYQYRGWLSMVKVLK
jgi:mycothiol synthase